MVEDAGVVVEGQVGWDEAAQAAQDLRGWPEAANDQVVDGQEEEQIDNGRFYLKEMVFGDPNEPRHSEALSIVAQTEEAIAAILDREKPAGAGAAATAARIVSAIMFVSMAASVNAGLEVEELVQDIRTQISVLISR